MLKVYLSGKISGEDFKLVKKLFKNKEDLIKRHAKKSGIEAEVFNPSTQGHGKEWHYYMKRDIKELVDADLVLDIGNNDGTSKGVKLEKRIARDLGIKWLSCDKAILYLHELGGKK